MMKIHGPSFTRALNALLEPYKEIESAASFVSAMAVLSGMDMRKLKIPPHDLAEAQQIYAQMVVSGEAARVKKLLGDGFFD